MAVNFGFGSLSATLESLLALFGGFKYLYAAQGTARRNNSRKHCAQSGAFSLIG
jgi:hypothetical protein